MTINHLNLCVADVAATRDFFIRYFDFACARPHDVMSVLTDDTGYVLTIMQAKPGDSLTYPGSFHVGFYVDEPTVRSLHATMTQDGLAPGEISSMARRGTMFYVTSPNGVLVEVCCPPPA